MMKIFFSLVVLIISFVSAELTPWGESPIYLLIDNVPRWVEGRIRLLNASDSLNIGIGYAPTFSYNKDRIAYINSKGDVIVASPTKSDTLLRTPVRNNRPAISWDSSGNLYYAQKLHIIKLDTATKSIDTVFTFKAFDILKSWGWEEKLADSVDWKEKLNFIDGNVVDGQYAAFTLQLDGFSATIWYCEFSHDTCWPVMYQYQACQATLSYDNKYVGGTFFSHRVLSLYPVSHMNTDTIAYENGMVWIARFFKFGPDLVAWHDGYQCHLWNYVNSQHLWVRGQQAQLFDYIPLSPYAKIEKKKPISTATVLSSTIITYDVCGRKVSNPRTPGVYIQRAGKVTKKFVIMR
jgi:hypothetical protein